MMETTNNNIPQFQKVDMNPRDVTLESPCPYRDFGGIKSDPSTSDPVGGRGGITNPFPAILHTMLEEVDENGYEHIVSWQAHGRSFMVHDINKFVELVMPKYFRQTKFSSFQRQLNLYGFNRMTVGRDKGTYYHELFLRGKPFLVNRMTRTRVKGTKVRTKSDPSNEPNFFNMPFMTGGKKNIASSRVIHDINPLPLYLHSTISTQTDDQTQQEGKSCAQVLSLPNEAATPVERMLPPVQSQFERSCFQGFPIQWMRDVMSSSMQGGNLPAFATPIPGKITPDSELDDEPLPYTNHECLNDFDPSKLNRTHELEEDDERRFDRLVDSLAL